uniref:Uncharacterized protein n=1 Tax=Panagrolaimus sp. ES5 TaxID=591445 RepID=A0AC34F6R5_9BILA
MFRYVIPTVFFSLMITAFVSNGFLNVDPAPDGTYYFNSKSHHDIPGRAVTQSREVQLTDQTNNNANIISKLRSLYDNLEWADLSTITEAIPKIIIGMVSNFK